MDTVTQTSLEALLLKATNPQNQNIDTAAVEAFCTLINKEKDGASIGVKVIASRLPSGNEKELLQTLNILDTCMNRCGSHFQSEVGKFRFLNEMIKLVSPKYLGAHTPLPVKQKVLQLMYLWTIDYPKESKVKEAYDMLKKQGVIREIPNPNLVEPNIPKRRSNSIFQDEEKSKILQKLLQSKDPEDVQAANWLIKSMVKEDDKRAELKSRRISELESVQNNVRLLNEMLDSYKPGISSSDEMDLISELHQSCQRLKPNVVKLATETSKNEEILGDILQITDELNQVFGKFHCLFNDKNESLLDFENGMSEEGASNCFDNDKTDIDVLCDIFNNSTVPDSNDILQPIAVLQNDKPEVDKDKKIKALEELDVLSEHLLKENLQSTTFKTQDKTPLNLIQKLSDGNKTESMNSKTGSFDLDLTYLITKPKSEPNTVNNNENDDFLVDLEEKTPESQQETPVKLNDIFIELEKIKPSTSPPLTVLEQKNGINITIHSTKDKPRNDVYVFVITTISKNELPISNYLFQAVVPKGCKLKLQASSGDTLPGFNPFLPPAAITQIMLISRKQTEIPLKFIVSYNLDGETCTEMGEVDL